MEGSFEGGEVGSDGSVQFLRLAQMAGEWTARAEAQYTATKEKQRLFAELHYAAASWDKLRPSAERSGASS